MTKQIFLKNLLAIGFGFIIGMSIFGLCAIVLLFFPDTFKSTVADIVIIAATSFTGGFLTASAASKFKIACSIITSLLLLLIFGSWMNFNFTDNSAQTFTLGLTCLISGIAGGVFANMKKSKQDM